MSRRSCLPTLTAVAFVAILVVTSSGAALGARTIPSRALSALPAVHISPSYLYGYSITAVPGSGLLNESLSVLAKSSQVVATFYFNWSFGDGSPRVNLSAPAVGGHNGSQTLSHIYASLGQYNVTVRISDNLNDKPQNISRFITLSSAFSASLTPNYRVATSGTAVLEDPIVSGGVPPYSAAWTATAPGCSVVIGSLNLTCQTTLVGAYHPVVTITDSATGKAVLYGNYSVNASLTLKPGYVAWYSCNGTLGTLQDNFTSGSAGGTNPISYSWNFGDGSPNGSGSSVKHLYALGATYQVQLRATDTGGASPLSNLSVSTSFSACSGVGSPNYQPPLIVLQGGVIALVVAIVLLLVLLRRGAQRSPPLAPPQPYNTPPYATPPVAGPTAGGKPSTPPK